MSKQEIIHAIASLFLIFYVLGAFAMQKPPSDDSFWQASPSGTSHGSFTDVTDGQKLVANRILKILGYDPEEITVDVVEFAIRQVKRLAESSSITLQSDAYTQSDAYAQSDAQTQTASGIGGLLVAQLEYLARAVANIPEENIFQLKVLLIATILLTVGTKVIPVVYRSLLAGEGEVDDRFFNKTLYENMCHISERYIDSELFQQEQESPPEVDDGQCFVQVIEVGEPEYPDDSENDLLLPFIHQLQQSADKDADKDDEALFPSMIEMDSDSDLPQEETPVNLLSKSLVVVPSSTPRQPLPTHSPRRQTSEKGSFGNIQWGYQALLTGSYFLGQLPCITYELVRFAGKQAKLSGRKKRKNGKGFKIHLVVWGSCQGLSVMTTVSADSLWSWYFAPVAQPSKQTQEATNTQETETQETGAQGTGAQEAGTQETRAQETTNTRDNRTSLLSRCINSGLTGAGCEIEALTSFPIVLLGEGYFTRDITYPQVVSSALVSAMYYLPCTMHAEYNAKDICTYMSYGGFVYMFAAIMNRNPELIGIPVSMFYGGITGIILSGLCRGVRIIYPYLQD